MEIKKKKEAETVRVIGVRRAAKELGVSECHVSLVARGIRPGSSRVNKAIKKYCKVVML